MKGSAEPLPHRARAKVNLTLRVVRRRRDGWHDIESLAAFATLADGLEITPGDGLSLEVRGPFAAQTPAGEENSVHRACVLFAQRRGMAPRWHVVLEKNIPPAAGLGGGSADAAAALRALAGLHGGMRAGDMAELALSLGSDVPVCLQRRPAMMRGRGERIEPVARLPETHLLLAKPQGGLTARQVYRRWDGMEKPEGQGEGSAPPAGMSLARLVAWCRRRPNGLQAAAADLLPETGRVLRALQESEDCLLARMSGSGPVCFGVYAGANAVQGARQRLAALHPDWWLHAGRLAAQPHSTSA